MRIRNQIVSVVKESNSHYDVTMLFSVLFLVGIGIVMVYSASSALALKKFGTSYFFLRKQLLFSLIGIGALVACRHFPLQWLRVFVYPFLGVALLLLLTIQISNFKMTAGGASRWVNIGGFTFQPSELTRLAVIIYLAYSLDKKSDRIQEFAIGFMPHFLVLCLFSALILSQPDFGSAVILAAITWGMMFAAGVPLKYLLTTAAAAVPAIYYLLSTSSYRMERILSFLDPWKYATNEGYQIIHSLMAFGSGGVWGTGIGKGYQKLFYLPEPHTDFIFSVIGEELGLLGVLVILTLYCIIVWKGVAIALEAESGFLTLLGFGLTISIGLQVLINIGVCLAILPTKGLTLPLISYGGTSLVLNMAAIGLLMNIRTRNKYEP